MPTARLGPGPEGTGSELRPARASGAGSFWAQPVVRRAGGTEEARGQAGDSGPSSGTNGRVRGKRARGLGFPRPPPCPHGPGTSTLRKQAPPWPPKQGLRDIPGALGRCSWALLQGGTPRLAMGSRVMGDNGAVGSTDFKCAHDLYGKPSACLPTSGGPGPLSGRLVYLARTTHPSGGENRQRVVRADEQGKGDNPQSPQPSFQGCP